MIYDFKVKKTNGEEILLERKGAFNSKYSKWMWIYTTI